jgi:hypothetical protein
MRNRRYVSQRGLKYRCGARDQRKNKIRAHTLEPRRNYISKRTFKFIDRRRKKPFSKDSRQAFVNRGILPRSSRACRRSFVLSGTEYVNSDIVLYIACQFGHCLS